MADLNQLVKKLNEIDIKDLQKLDYKKLLKDAQKRPDVIVSIVAVLATVIFSVNYFRKQHGEIRTTSLEIMALEEKITAIEEYQQTDQELKDFLRGIPENITEEDLINQITDFAQARNVRIESFSPGRKQTEDLYELTSIVLSITVNEYRDLWLFTHDVEASPHALRIDSLNVKANEQPRSRGRNAPAPKGPKGSTLSATMEIAAIALKKENE